MATSSSTNSRVETNEGHEYPHATDVFKYLRRHVTVRFALKDRPKEIRITLELRRDMTLSEVCRQLAEKTDIIRVPASQIRLTTKRETEYVPSKPLKRLLSGSSSRSQANGTTAAATDPTAQGGEDDMQDVVFYEELPVPVEEFSHKKQLNVRWVTANVQEVTVHRVIVERQASVREVLKDIKKTVPILNSEIHLLEIDNNHEIRRILKEKDSVSDIGHRELRAEPVVSSDPTMGKADQVPVTHFDSRWTGTQSSRTALHRHGNPFLLVVYAQDTIRDVKHRIQEKLEGFKEDFRLAILVGDQAHYVQDESSTIQREAQQLQGQMGWRLGMDHKDMNMTRAATGKPGLNNAVVIHN